MNPILDPRTYPILFAASYLVTSTVAGRPRIREVLFSLLVAAASLPLLLWHQPGDTPLLAITPLFLGAGLALHRMGGSRFSPLFFTLPPLAGITLAQRILAHQASPYLPLALLSPLLATIGALGSSGRSIIVEAAVLLTLFSVSATGPAWVPVLLFLIPPLLLVWLDAGKRVIGEVRSPALLLVGLAALLLPLPLITGSYATNILLLVSLAALVAITREQGVRGHVLAPLVLAASMATAVVAYATGLPSTGALVAALIVAAAGTCIAVLPRVGRDLGRMIALFISALVIVLGLLALPPTAGWADAAVVEAEPLQKTRLCGEWVSLGNIGVSVEEDTVLVQPNTSSLEALRSDLVDIGLSPSETMGRPLLRLLLEGVLRGFVENPGLVSAVSAGSVGEEFEERAVLEEPQMLVISPETMVYVGLEEDVLRISMVSKGLVLPPKALSALPLENMSTGAFHHMFFIANFSEPLIVLIGGDWRLEATSVEIVSSSFLGGRGRVSLGIGGLVFEEAVVGILNGKLITGDGEFRIPTKVGEDTLNLYRKFASPRPGVLIAALDPEAAAAVLGNLPREAEVPAGAKLRTTLNGAPVEVSYRWGSGEKSGVVWLNRGIGACVVAVDAWWDKGPFGTRQSTLRTILLESIVERAGPGERIAAASALAEGGVKGLADFYWLVRNPPAVRRVALRTWTHPYANLVWLTPGMVIALGGLASIIMSRETGAGSHGLA